MPAMKVKKGDLVQMLSGKDRGKQGRVIDARPSEGRVVVENLNVAKRHTKPRQIKTASRGYGGGSGMTAGGILDRATAVPVGNVMVVCPICKLPTRIGYTTKQGKGGETVKVRVCRREGCGQEIDR
jgi:large subunit ribosomal protein L24